MTPATGSPTPRFRVELTGPLGLFEAVAPRLQADRLKLTIDGGKAYLTSVDFDSMTSAAEVVELAQRMVPLIAAAMRLLGVRPGEIGATQVWEDTPSGQKGSMFVFAQAASLIVEALPPTILIDGKAVAQPNIPVNVGLSDTAAAIALEFFAADPTWASLYKVLDLIEGDQPKGQTIVKRGWASQEELDRFTGTANNYYATGKDARHAKLGHGPMKAHQPMNLDEGILLFRRLLEQWLASKI